MYTVSFLTWFISILFVFYDITLANQDELFSCNAQQNRIFSSILCGDLITKDDGIAYWNARSQFASISHAKNVMPSIIVFAECDEDITIALEYARKWNYKVVMRSGGHQYTGLSSCNWKLHKCIQVDLSRYNNIAYNEERNELKLGAGTHLVDFNQFLAAKRLFIPHGDCKSVAIGGHFQGGGQGHIHNQFGLVSDHVLGFDIFLANGTLVRVRKPTNWQVNIAKTKKEYSKTTTHELNDLLYYAVIGGNHGSFGVITNVFLAPLKDKDYEEKSVFYDCDWNFDTKILYNMLGTMQKIYAEDPDFNRKNVDYGFYLRILKGEPWGNVIKFLGSFVSTSGAPLNNTYFERFIQSANEIKAVECNPMFIAPSTYLKRAAVDHVFELQTFETRLQVSPFLLSDDFIAAYAQRMALLFGDSLYNGVNIYADVVFAGGNFLFTDQGDKRTAVGGSTPNLQVNTDVYYDENVNKNAKEITKTWINETWTQFMDTKTFGFGAVDARACDASFDNVNMTEVWPFYYGGNMELYSKLRKIKTKVDPNDLFSNTFTLKPY